MKVYVCDFFDENGQILVLDKKGFKNFLREKLNVKEKKKVEHDGYSERVIKLLMH